MFLAQIGHTLSIEHPIIGCSIDGIPQESALSSLVYAIFTADIPKLPRTCFLIYADDTAILVHSKSAYNVTTYLQVATNALEEWCRRWLITVNPAKSSALCITKSRQGPIEHVSMFGQIIPWQDKTKYLGLFTDRRFSIIP